METNYMFVMYNDAEDLSTTSDVRQVWELWLSKELDVTIRVLCGNDNGRTVNAGILTPEYALSNRHLTYIITHPELVHAYSIKWVVPFGRKGKEHWSVRTLSR